MKKFDSIEIGMSDFSLTKWRVLVNRAQLGKALSSRAYSFAKCGARSDSIHNSMIKPISPLVDSNVLFIRHLQKVVRAADKNSNQVELEVSRINNDFKRTKLASDVDRLSHEELKSRVKRADEKKHKKYEKRDAHPAFKEIFEGLPVKRVYSDQVTFVFKNEDEFVAVLEKVIERHKSENWE